MSLYMVPVVLGVFGILFARGLDAPVFRGIALLVSVGGPLLAAVYILLNLTSRGLERVLLVGGILLLMMGALATASSMTQVLAGGESVPKRVENLSQWIGLVSLLLGMLALLASTVRTDEAVEEIGARFRYLADQMGEGFVLTDSDGIIVLVNQRLLEQTGLTEKSVVGRNARELAEQLDGEVMLPKITDVPPGQSDEYNCTWTVGGEERHFLLSRKPLHNRRGRLAGTLATVRDVTEQHNLAKRLERYTHGLQKLVEDRTQKLRQSEEQFRDLLLSMNEGFLTVDGNFRICFVNDRMCEVLRLGSQALLGREIFEFIDVAGRGRLLDLFEAARSGSAQRMQQEFVFVSEGNEVPAMVAVAPVLDVFETPEEESRGARYSLVVTDITELKRMQRQLEMRANELQTANDELKMLDRAKDGFLSNVTHELKTPLATIRGYVEMLEAGGLGELQPTQVNALTVMERNAQRLGLLIEEMIEFSRMQIRGIQLSLSLFAVRSLVQDCVSSVRPQSAPRNVSIETALDPDATVVWADRKRVAQVLSILLSNAVKFSHPDGRIDVTATRRPDNSLALSVTDRGIGIPPAFQERVFDKFFQVDSSHTRRYEGTGIGLSIAKSIAEAHGGAIELKSQPQAGSTFTLVLPHAVFDVENVEPDERLGNVRVVLADDEEESRKALRGVLTQAGCEVVVVRSGYECVRVARETEPAIILLSEMLPDLSGQTTYLKLREEPSLSDVCVILLGGRNGVQADEPGMEDLEYLPKPFGAHELLAKVREGSLLEPATTTKSASFPQGNGHKTRTSVLVVDSDTDFQSWIEIGLHHRQIDCCCVADVNEAVGVAGAFKPDVILLGVDGATVVADALTRLREAQATREIPVYVLTGLPTEYYDTLDVAGALRKPFALSEIVDLVLDPRVHS